MFHLDKWSQTFTITNAPQQDIKESSTYLTQLCSARNTPVWKRNMEIGWEKGTGGAESTSVIHSCLFPGSWKRVQTFVRVQETPVPIHRKETRGVQQIDTGWWNPKCVKKKKRIVEKFWVTGGYCHIFALKDLSSRSHLREGKSLLLNYAIDLPPLLCSCLRHCENPVYAVCFPILQHRSLRR